ncbi:MAG: YegS/Rv2252/BmrU family lipid kinase [Lachnospiraceae bacterium]|nr:YegS/Rv2252/BmrU family lipid kinase [Lachnospiraceae bacterium]
MERKKLFFIYNPQSGKGLIRVHLVDILDVFVKAGYEVTVYPTQGKGDATRVISACADEYDRIVCSGGDGTLDEVVTGMIQGDSLTPLGYIPAGTTNDFAQSLKIPGNMAEAAEIAAHGNLIPCDVGEFNDDAFIYVAACGIFTGASYQTNQRLKHILGHAAYVIEGARQLTDIQTQTYSLEIQANGETVRGNFVYGMVSNSLSVGGMKNLVGKDVELDDGLFEVKFIRMPQNPLQINEIMQHLFRPRDCDTPYIYSCKSDQVEIHCEVPVPWTLDGEFGGEHKDVRIINHYRRITFMVE